jgi:hypothetical protein
MDLHIIYFPGPCVWVLTLCATVTADISQSSMDPTSLIVNNGVEQLSSQKLLTLQRNQRAFEGDEHPIP